jgi:hypothetical protein
MALPDQYSDARDHPSEFSSHALRRLQRPTTDNVRHNQGYDHVWQDPLGRVTFDYNYGHGYGSREGWRSLSRIREQSRERENINTYSVNYRDTVRA